MRKFNLFLILVLMLPNLIFGQDAKNERSKKKVKDQGENCLYMPIGNGAGISDICEQPDRESWQLIFEDQFDGTTLDQSKWMSGYGWCDYAGDALYVPENIVLKDGEMALFMDPENKIGKGISYFPDDHSLHLYGDTKVRNKREWQCTGAAIRSYDKFMYGKFEIRCKFDNNKNYFPAFWLFSGPAYSEIDIFEFKGQWGGVSNNMHHNSKNDGTPNNSCGERIDPLFPWHWSKDWHTYTCEWDPFKIMVFIDGELHRVVYRFIKEGDRKPILNYEEYLKNSPLILQNKAFPTRPMHLIANITADDEEGNDIERGAMHVDYIKAWSKYSRFDHLDEESGNGMYLKDDHKYFPIESEIIDLVHYSKEDEISNFIDGQGEDFNHDGQDEFVSVRNYDGALLIHSVVKEDGKFKFIDRGRYFVGDSLQWSGVTCGDVDGDGRKEIVGLLKNIGIVVWEPNYIRGEKKYKLNQKMHFPLAQEMSGKVGIECGDFNLDGIDEIAFVQNDSVLTILSYDGGLRGLHVFKQLVLNSKGSQFVDLTVGDFDGNEFDDIALVNNENGNLNIIAFNDLNEPYVKTTWELPSALSEWTSISSGQYLGADFDQIVLHRKLDNLLTIVNAKRKIEVINYNYSCTYPVAIGSGFFNGSCENFVVMNSFGEYELKAIPGRCARSIPDLHPYEAPLFKEPNQVIWKDIIQMNIAQKFQLISF